MIEGPQYAEESEGPISVPNIKEEEPPQPVDISSDTALFTPRPAAPTTLSKRSLDELHSARNGDNKRVKMEHDVLSLEDEMARLVQDALGGIGPLANQIPVEKSTFERVDETSRSVESSSLGPRPKSQDQTAGQSHAPTFAGPWRHLQIMSLPVLGSLAVQLLLMLSQQPPDDAFGLLEDPSYETSKAYTTLLSLFCNARALYSETTVVLSAHELDFRDTDSQNTLRLTNLATMCAAIISSGPIRPLTELCAVLPETLLPRAVDLSPSAAEVLLGLKTQNALETLESWPDGSGGGQTKSELLNAVLFGDLEARLRRRHPESGLSNVEQHLLDNVKARKEELLECAAQDEPDIPGSRSLYLDDLLSGLRSFLDMSREMFMEDAERFNIPFPTLESRYDTEDCDTPDVDLDDFSSFMERATSGLVRDALTHVDDCQREDDSGLAKSLGEQVPADIAGNAVSPPNIHKVDVTDYKELEALVAENTAHYVRNTLNGLSPAPFQLTVPASTDSAAPRPQTALDSNPDPVQQYHHPSPHLVMTSPGFDAAGGITGSTLPPNQSFPSSILYEKARQAALSKSSAHTRREGIHSTRRPWTQEEEKALMAGLDMVKGPHWSQILSLFGPNGTMSDILKDRTQVQLKDKARNLKLFFLKTNSEMPFYLQAVTGELKTRAPTQAARKEAEERAKLDSEEEHARFRGIMALAGGLQSNVQPGRQIQPSLAPAAPMTAIPALAVPIAPAPPPRGVLLPLPPASAAPTTSAAPAVPAASQQQQKPALSVPHSSVSPQANHSRPIHPQRVLQPAIQDIQLLQPHPSPSPPSHSPPQPYQTTVSQPTVAASATTHPRLPPPPPPLQTPPKSTPRTSLGDTHLSSPAEHEAQAHDHSQDAVLLQGLTAAVANST